MPTLATNLRSETNAENQAALISITGTPVSNFTTEENSKVVKQRPKWTPELVERLRKDFVPPDGGYAWFIVAGAFVVQFWVAGLIKSYGVIFLEVLQLFPDASASVASWIPAMLATLWMLSSPIVSGLCERFTCRAVVFVGGLFCFAGLVLSYFATTLVQLCFSFGVLGGLGAGMSTTPGIIMASRFFLKRRALANGICISGTSAGSIILPPLVEFLVPKYGFHGTLLILGACMLHVFIAASLFRPYEVHQWIQEVNSKKSTSRRKSQLRKEQTEIFQLDPESDSGIAESGIIRVDMNQEMATEQNFVHSEQLISAKQSNTSSVTNLEGSGMKNTPLATNQKRGTSAERERLLVAPANGELSSAIPHHQGPESCVVNSTEDICSSSTFVKRDHVDRTPNVDLESHAPSSQAEPNLKNCLKPRKTSVWSPLLRYLDVGLVKNPLFMLISLTVMLMGMGCPHALFYVPAHVNSLGYSKGDAGLLLSVSAVFDLAGRLLSGYIADLKLFRNSLGYLLSMAMAGMGVLCIPWVTSYWALGIMVSFYGFGLGTWFLYVPVLMAEHHGTQKFASAYGLIRMFQGTTALAIPPFAGFLKDVTGSYVPCFLFMGCAMLLGACLTLLEPCAKILVEKRKLGQR